MKYSCLLFIVVLLKAASLFLETLWDIAGQAANKCMILNLLGRTESATSASSGKLIQMTNSAKTLAFRFF